jgi:hypothetical protein
MIPIKIHKHASDPYWAKLEEGQNMSIEERYQKFFLMLKRNRAMTGKPKLGDRTIVIKSIDGFRR